jgi:hypothetical protein
MKTIDRLIFDALAEHRSVSLPGEGTLEVRRRSAKMISDTQIIPPSNRVVFTSGAGEDSGSVISLIMSEMGVGEDEAGAMYSSWLASARRPDGSIAIEGVCERLGDDFSVADELDAALNPEGEEPLDLEPEKKRGRGLLWVLIAILALLAILVVVLLYQKGCIRFPVKSPAVETVVVAPVTPDPARADSLATAEAPAVVAPAGPRFHVIAGAFAIESNADNYIKQLKREHPELTLEKVVYPPNGYNMVSILQTPTLREARRMVNNQWDLGIYDLWIYKQE